MKHTPSFLLSICLNSLILVLASCGGNSHDNPRPSPDKNADERSLPQENDVGLSTRVEQFLLYSGTDVLFSSASVNVINLETGEHNSLLTGQSRDLIIRKTGGRFFAINREAGFQDIREISVTVDGDKAKFQISAAVSLASLTPGDPHDIALINNDEIFIAAYSGKESSVLNLSTKDLRPVIADNQPQRIETIGTWADDKLLLLRQGLDRDFSVDGSQKLEVRKKTLRNALPLISETALNTSIPLGLFSTKLKHIFQTITFCGTFFANCKSGLESINVEDGRSELRSSFDGEGFTFYGPTVQLPTRDEIYASVLDVKTNKKYVAVIDQTYGKITRMIHDFPEGKYSGYWGIFSDDESNTLIVGDAISETKGRVSIYRKDEPEIVFEIPNIPSGGEVISLKNE